MIETLERPSAPARQTTHSDERAARRTLLNQVERLERDLAEQFSSAWPRKGLDWGVHAPSSRPRMLDLGQLEQLRDALANRVEDARRDLRDRKRVEDANRLLVEDMLRHPERHHWVRVSHEDIGEPGCRHWHVVPRYGPLGRLMNWWRVKISSGCPLAT